MQCGEMLYVTHGPIAYSSKYTTADEWYVEWSEKINGM